ncbi:CinA family protein [Pseudahrensia aquimaris]|uniref:CinA family protein n=1 Tax=Pseudahrensia aquimaris TaxID=744461 RepID=A0ABW3FGK6_9HYPH
MIHPQAQQLIEAAIAQSVIISTAESCTGGMIAAALTDVAGSSAAFDRGFVTYSNEAKAEMLGVPLEHTQGPPGAVSALVAQEMVAGALARSAANLAVAVTGIAGPGGGSEEKPVGLVYVAVQREGSSANVRECRFAESHGATTREAIRQATVDTALEMMLAAL